MTYPYPSIFETTTVESLLARINALTPETQPQWGKMNVAQMLAHSSVAFDILYDVTPITYNAVMRFFLKTFVKQTVVGKKPYKKNGQTAPVFLITDERDFQAEKAKLIGYIKRMHQEGAAAVEGKKSDSFGVMTSHEWSTQMVKHLDHHLRQFGV